MILRRLSLSQFNCTALLEQVYTPGDHELAQCSSNDDEDLKMGLQIDGKIAVTVNVQLRPA